MYVCVCMYVWVPELRCVCMFVCVGACGAVCMHVCMCGYLSCGMYICVYVCMCGCLWCSMYVCMRVHVYIDKHSFEDTDMHAVCIMYIYIYTYIYIYIYIHTYASKEYTTNKVMESLHACTHSYIHIHIHIHIHTNMNIHTSTHYPYRHLYEKGNWAITLCKYWKKIHVYIQEYRYIYIIRKQAPPWKRLRIHCMCRSISLRWLVSSSTEAANEAATSK